MDGVCWGFHSTPFLRATCARFEHGTAEQARTQFNSTRSSRPVAKGCAATRTPALQAHPGLKTRPTSERLLCEKKKSTELSALPGHNGEKLGILRIHSISLCNSMVPQ